MGGRVGFEDLLHISSRRSPLCLRFDEVQELQISSFVFKLVKDVLKGAVESILILFEMALHRILTHTSLIVDPFSNNYNPLITVDKYTNPHLFRGRFATCRAKNLLNQEKSSSELPVKWEQEFGAMRIRIK